MKYLGRIDDPKDLVTKEYVDGSITHQINYPHGSEGFTATGDSGITEGPNDAYFAVGIYGTDSNGDPEDDIDLMNQIRFSTLEGATWTAYNTPINIEAYAGFNYNGNEVATLADVHDTSFYTTSTTAAATAAKTTATVSGYKLRTGNIIVIKFSNANTYVSNKITLNINSTGAKDIWYRGVVTSSTNTLTWNAGDTLTFVYTGSAYLCIGKDTSVFVATYGTTTYAEIENAYNADIPIIVKDTTSNHTATGTTNIYQLLDKTLLGFRFSSIDNYLTVKFCFVNTSNTWSYQSRMGLYKVNGKTSNDAASDPGAITLDADDVGALASDGIAQRSRRLQEYDSRNVNDTPADLMSDPGAGVFSDFKTTTVINTGEAPTAAYYQVISYVPWSNNSGGRPVQMAIANKAGVPLIYTRSASSDSAWGSWKKLAFTDSDITGNAATATEADSVNGSIWRLDAKTSITSLANLKTQLTTWHDDTTAQSQALFYFTPSGSWSPFTSGAAVHVIISRGTNISTATFYSRNLTTPVIAMMTYVSSAWSDFTIMATTDDINTAIGSAILASY